MIAGGISIGTKEKTDIGSGVFGINTGEFCPEMEAIYRVARAKNYPMPTDYQMKVLNFWINEQKANGLWSKTDLMYMFGYNSLKSHRILESETLVQASSNAFLETLARFTYINLKDPTRFELTRYTSNTTSPYYSKYGWKINTGNISSSNYLDTGFTHANFVNWTQNNASFACYLHGSEAGGASRVVVGARDSVNNRCIIALNPSDGTNANILINGLDTSAHAVGAITSPTGFFHGERTGANTTKLYVNNVDTGVTSNRLSGSLISTSRIYFFARNVDNSSADFPFVGNPLGFAAFRSALTAAQRKTDYELFTEFKTRLNF